MFETETLPRYSYQETVAIKPQHIVNGFLVR